METEASAQAAISDLNGKEVDGQALTVNEVKPGRGGPVPTRDGGAWQTFPGCEPTALTAPSAIRHATLCRQPALFREKRRPRKGSLPRSARSVRSAWSLTASPGNQRDSPLLKWARRKRLTRVIEKFNGQEVLGRVLKVNAARPTGTTAVWWRWRRPTILSAAPSPVPDGRTPDRSTVWDRNRSTSAGMVSPPLQTC